MFLEELQTRAILFDQLAEGLDANGNVILTVNELTRRIDTALDGFPRVLV